MKIEIELSEGNKHSWFLSKQGIEKNISTQKRAIDGKSLSCDFVSLSDTLSILEAIKNKVSTQTGKE